MTIYSNIFVIVCALFCSTCEDAEWNCQGPPCEIICEDDEYKCEVDLRCIPESYLCDGMVDCFDGADERDCSK